jgi:hypothetical protein
VVARFLNCHRQSFHCDAVARVKNFRRKAADADDSGNESFKEVFLKSFMFRIPILTGIGFSTFTALGKPVAPATVPRASKGSKSSEELGFSFILFYFLPPVVQSFIICLQDRIFPFFNHATRMPSFHVFTKTTLIRVRRTPSLNFHDAKNEVIVTILA